MEAKPYPITEAVVEQRRAAATRHGTQSEVQIRAVARNKKRLILRRLGVQARDLDAVCSVLVDVLARFASKIELLDRYYEGRGIVRQGGEPEPTLPVYLGLLNGARLTAERLGVELRRRGDRSERALADYIEATYSNGSDGGE